MTTHAPMARVPFAPLDNPRLQHLASAKNRQNGAVAPKSPSNGKANVFISTGKTLSSPKKRSFELSVSDENDNENVDPAIFSSPSKKRKSDAWDQPLPFTFTAAPSKSMLPPPTVPSRFSTPARANMSSPRAPLTAPAGRSPKRKASHLTKNRRISAPFSRVDPPFGTRNMSLPFSLDAAINGTFSNSAPKDAGATLEETTPKNWVFDIYEDTPEEEAATFMEHSTLTLDLSSDEESSKKARDDRGKENMPPEGYNAPTASRPASEPTVAAPRRIKKTEIIRKKVQKEAMDDGERSPLSDLETDSFIPEGLDKDSHIIVNATSEKSDSSSSQPVVWEDSSSSEQTSSPSQQAENRVAPTKAAVSDENALPIIDEVL